MFLTRYLFTPYLYLLTRIFFRKTAFFGQVSQIRFHQT